MTTYSLIVTFREGTGATWKGLTRARCRKLVQSLFNAQYARPETVTITTVRKP